jgi:hypothetical protein
VTLLQALVVVPMQAMTGVSAACLTADSSRLVGDKLAFYCFSKWGSL